MKRALALLAVIVLLALCGCDDVRRDAFGGLLGTVGYPPIADCEVDLYDGIQFQSLDSTAGLIRKTRTDAAGRFAVEFDDSYLGRPIIAVARPGPTAMYRDFGATGTPDIAFDAPHQPWVGVLDEWLGGEDTVTINPITTMAFHALMRLPITEVGPGALRFDREVVQTTHSALAANFGFRSDPAAELPAPPGGPLFVPVTANYLENNDRATAYTYACLQLAKAANDFAATSAGADNALDFYEALFADAQDGALDGQYFGQAQAFLNQVPSVVGRDVDGASRLLRWIATVPLNATEQGYAGTVRGGVFDPLPSFMLALQADATGAARPMRIDSIDVWNFPFSGNVELTIRGAGMRRSDNFLVRSFDAFNDSFTVDRDSVGVDGQFNFQSDTELRVRLPDFGVTTKAVANGLRVPTGVNFRRLSLEILNRPEYEKLPRQARYILTDNARVTTRTEPLLVHAAIGRVDAPGGFAPATGSNNVYPAAKDPGALVIGTDQVYELALRVANPSVDTFNGLTLDLAATTLLQLGNPVVLDQFSGTATGRAFILPDTLPSTNLAPGGVVTLAYRFVFLDSAIPADLAAGADITLTPVLTATSSGAGTPTVTTNDVTDFTRPVHVAPVIEAQTAQLTTLAITLPATVTEGTGFDLDLALTSGPLSGGLQRDLRVETLDLVITFDGTTTLLHLGDAFFAGPGGADTTFESCTLVATGGTALPVLLTNVGNSQTLRLHIGTTVGHLGAFSVTATATGRDVASGMQTTAADAAATSVTP
ncbi:MAG: hypothetical protein IPP14_11010 [Planctomycetes bacterium]|nr:hypothetical protein [Planctomycetota bacterium]